jgi:CheY-like chemotaxis protein
MDALLRSSIGGSIRVETVLGAGLWPALADQTQLELVILNLAINARDAMPVGGTIVIETRNVTCGAPGSPEEPPPGDYVAVAVSDTGTGMSEEVRRRAFEPFFTTKQTGKGSGLGLSMVFGVARQSGGGVTLASKVGEGTTVTVYLPRAVADAARNQDEGMPPPGSLVLVGGEVILLVDDDSDVREVTTALLNSLGYGVLEAGSGPAALDLLASGERVDAMLVDIAMPGMDGIETARRAQGLRPEIPVLFATGYVDLSRFAEQPDPQRLVRKPYRRAELVEKLRAALTRISHCREVHRGSE